VPKYWQKGAHKMLMKLTPSLSVKQLSRIIAQVFPYQLFTGNERNCDLFQGNVGH